jgi:hypothetical protein
MYRRVGGIGTHSFTGSVQLWTVDERKCVGELVVAKSGICVTCVA